MIGYPDFRHIPHKSELPEMAGDEPSLLVMISTHV
jgi:hypothetical protein